MYHNSEGYTHNSFYDFWVESFLKLEAKSEISESKKFQLKSKEKSLLLKLDLNAIQFFKEVQTSTINLHSTNSRARQCLISSDNEM